MLEVGAGMRCISTFNLWFDFVRGVTIGSKLQGHISS